MQRDKIIADAMGKRARAELKRSGTQRARGKHEEAEVSGSLMFSEKIALAALFQVERMTGIEPALSAWEADVLPLNYIRRLCLRPRRGQLGCPCPHIVQEQVACLRAPLRS
jgi:hypothetical protein